MNLPRFDHRLPVLGPLAPFRDDAAGLMEQIAALRRERDQWRELAQLAIGQLHTATDRTEQLTIRLVETQHRLAEAREPQRTAA